jgi:hypothetical protein
MGNLTPVVRVTPTSRLPCLPFDDPSVLEIQLCY